MSTTTHKRIINWSDDDQCYMVKVPDLPGCLAHGQTRQQAVKMAEVAKEPSGLALLTHFYSGSVEDERFAVGVSKAIPIAKEYWTKLTSRRTP